MSGWNLVRARLDIMLLVASCLLPAAAGAREILGTVTHAVGKDTLSKLPLSCGRIDEPWPELRVQNASFLERIDWTEKATDDEGRFSFQADADGRWIIVTRDSHYTFPRGYVVVTQGPGETPAPLDLVVCDGARREVSVFGPDGRTPLDHPENIRLVMDPTNPEIRPDMYVVKPAHELPLARIVGKYQGDGVVVLGPAPPGYYELYSTPDDGFRFAKVDQRVDRSLEGAPLQWKEWRTRTLRCMPVPLLQAKFILPDGSPAAGAEANLITQPNWMNGLRADADGVLRFDQDEQLPLGNVRISLPGYAGVFKPEQFSTDPTAAPWLLEVDNAPSLSPKAGVVSAKKDELIGTEMYINTVEDTQGYPLAGAVVTFRRLGIPKNQLDAQVVVSDDNGLFSLPYSSREAYSLEVAHEAYGERKYIITYEGAILDKMPYESNLYNPAITLPLAGKLIVEVSRDGQLVGNANVVAFSGDGSMLQVPNTSQIVGKYLLSRAVAGANGICATISESLGDSSFLRTRYAEVDVPSHGEASLSIQLGTGDASLKIDGESSEINTLVFHLELASTEGFEVYRWNRDAVDPASLISGLPAGRGSVYIDYGDAGFKYVPIILKAGETTVIQVGHPDMVTVTYKPEFFLKFPNQCTELVVMPSDYLSHVLRCRAIYDHPAALGGGLFAASGTLNESNEFEIRVPRETTFAYFLQARSNEGARRRDSQNAFCFHHIDTLAIDRDTTLKDRSEEVEAIPTTTP